jgi:hypothetical protein
MLVVRRSGHGCSGQGYGAFLGRSSHGWVQRAIAGQLTRGRLPPAPACDIAADLIRADGYEPVSVGGLDQSIRIEMFGDLHEFGALGRVVTKPEALAAI